MMTLVVHNMKNRSKYSFLFYLMMMSLCSWTLLIDISFPPSTTTTTTTTTTTVTSASASAFQMEFSTVRRRQQSTIDSNKHPQKTLIKLQNHDNDYEDKNIIDPASSSNNVDVDVDVDRNNNNIENIIRRYYDPNLIRYRCRVAYDGSKFVGFQIQQQKPPLENKKFRFQKRTVQNELESVLSKRFNRPIRVVGAGRTDAGVHARGQAVHFDLSLKESNSLLLKEEENSKTMIKSSVINDTTTTTTTIHDNNKSGDDDDGWDFTTTRGGGGGGGGGRRHNYNKNLPLLQTAMNRMLPSDVRVWNIQMAPEPCVETPGKQRNNTSTKDNINNNGHNNNEITTTTTTAPPPFPPPHSKQGIYAWNVMQKATGKLYSYRICINDSMDPILRHSRWQIPDRPQNINPTMLQEVLKTYEGTHNFICFAGAIEQNERKTGRKISTIRTVHSIELITEDENLGLYRIDIKLDGALYKMVRNLVGTAIDVCLGNRLSITQFQQLLFLNSSSSSEDETTTTTTTTTTSSKTKSGCGRKRNPCKPAPPQGLTLERVYYDEDNELF